MHDTRPGVAPGGSGTLWVRPDSTARLSGQVGRTHPRSRVQTPFGAAERRGNLWANPIGPLPWMLAPLAAVAAFPNNGVAVSIEPLSRLPGGLSDRCTVAPRGNTNAHGGGANPERWGRWFFIRSFGAGRRRQCRSGSTHDARWIARPVWRIGRSDRGTATATR